RPVYHSIVRRSFLRKQESRIFSSIPYTRFHLDQKRSILITIPASDGHSCESRNPGFSSLFPLPSPRIPLIIRPLLRPVIHHYCLRLKYLFFPLLNLTCHRFYTTDIYCSPV